MEIAEIRRRNLDLLEAEAKSLEAIAAAMRAADAAANPGTPAKAPPNYANYLSQVKGGTRNMGDRVARKVEAGMGKSRGWMDQLQAADISMLGKEAGQLVDGMDESKREIAMQMLRALNESNPKKSAASPFGPIPRGGRRADRPKRNPGTQ